LGAWVTETKQCVDAQLVQSTWDSILAILGPEAAVLPLADFDDGGFDSATFSTVGAGPFTFTWSPSQPANFTTPPSGKGDMPAVTLNGTNERAQTPDADYWSSVASPSSMGLWVKPDVVNDHNMALLVKDDGVGREFDFYLRDDGKVQISLQDNITGVTILRISSSTLVAGEWTYVVVTQNGATGGFAADSINIYINGSLDNGFALNNPIYSGMHNSTSFMSLGFRTDVANMEYQGSLAGGPVGPFFVPRELTAAEVAALYALGQTALGLP
jgi:hypothetical protein